MYINDLNVAIKHCKVHYFADDTNLLNINKSPKHLNKSINIDLKNLTKWLNANKISLNVSKTEMVLFRPKRKSMDFNLKIKLNGKRLYETNSVKYLGIRIDSNFNWKAHIALKLIKANAMLYKVRYFVDTGILKSIYHALFESHIHYVCVIWGQNLCTINRVFILQKKALRQIHFKERNVHSAPIFFKSKIVKLPGKIKIENCLFISKYVSNKLLHIFNSWFIFSFTCHNHKTSFAAKGHLKIPTVNSTTYGKGSFISMDTKTGNNTQSQIKDSMINSSL